MRNWMLLAGLIVGPSCAFAANQIVLDIDPGVSNGDFELCAIGSCDSDNSAILGHLVIGLNAPQMPTQLGIFELEIQLADNLAFDVPVLLGGIAVQTQDLALTYPFPGVQFGPAMIDGALFELVSLPVRPSGLASYNATGLACVFLEGAGVACRDDFDLGAVGEQTADSVMGFIQVIDDEITVVILTEISLPVLPSDPDLAQLIFRGSILATGTVPPAVPGDFDKDADADIFDFQSLLDCYSGPAGGLSPPRCEVFDFDGDSDVDVPDFGAFQIVFTGE